METIYQVQTVKNVKPMVVEVPGSKSITNRALMLAALSNGPCLLKGVLFSDDSRAFLKCLQSLGFQVEINEDKKEVLIYGLAGEIPNRNAEIHVQSAGTAARFLTVMLAFAGGNYRLNSSEQMKKRPMEPLLSVLKSIGVTIHFLEKEGHFPFEIQSQKLSPKEIHINTDISSQFASALLMSAVLLEDGLTLIMEGSRTEGSYIKITLEMMKQFGISYTKEDNVCHVPKNNTFSLASYVIEPDLSGACYFYAMAPLLKTNVTVKNVFAHSLQGDIQFLSVLEQLGCKLHHLPEGIMVEGTKEDYPGITLSMKDFSDQTMTMAVIAAFATSKTCIQNVSHIRFQESNRMEAICNELHKLGIRCEIGNDFEDITIYPGPMGSAVIETYEDHRMAMAFALVGLLVEGVAIKNPACCSKTFENYFELLEQVTR